MAKIYLRASKHKPGVYTTYQNMSAALDDKSSLLTDELFEGEVALRGKITTVMVPMRTVEEFGKKVSMSCDGEDFEDG